MKKAKKKSLGSDKEYFQNYHYYLFKTKTILTWQTNVLYANQAHGQMYT